MATSPGFSIFPDEIDLGDLGNVDVDSPPIERLNVAVGPDPDNPGTFRLGPATSIVYADEPPPLAFGEGIGTVFVSASCRFFDRRGEELT